MFTIDASVHINALNPAEAGSVESQVFLARLCERPWPVFAPTLLLVEVAAAVTRAMSDAAQGMAMAQVLRSLPAHVWVPLDDLLAEEAARLAVERRLRGADAVYAAVAQRYGALLVTRDGQQLERLPPAVTVLSPKEAIACLEELARAGDQQAGGD